MTEKDITKIRVGRFDISLIGLEQIISELAPTHQEESDEAIADLLLERLGRHNYIPAGAREEYARAFVREFRKYTGQPYQEDTSEELEIKVLGMGCAQCDSLAQTVMGLLTELALPASLEHVTDIKEIARYGVMGTPALVINGKVVAVGRVPSRNQLKAWLIDTQSSFQKK